MIDPFSISDPVKQRILDISDAGSRPFYLYDTKRIQHNCLDFTNIPYSPKSVYFAMMANSNPEFIKIVKEAGLKIFVNSLMHLDIAVSLGFEGNDIVYAASAMDESAMRSVKMCGADLVLDSRGQMDQWQALFPGTGIGIRCNIGDAVVPKKTTGGFYIGHESRLGLSMETIQKMEGNLLISGLHIYVGTNISDVDYFLTCYRHIAGLALLFPRLEYIDLGGGFGSGEKTTQKFDMEKLGQQVTRLMKHVSDQSGHEIKLKLEPGRIIGADAGYFVCRVTDVKTSGQKQFIGVNASSVQFPRPLFYPDTAWHPVLIVEKNGSAKESPTMFSSVYGCSTYSRDFLAQDVELPLVRPGDLVILGNAGSYCAAAYTSFLGFPKAEEFFL